MSREILYVATDGACVANGRQSAKAGWGIFVSKEIYAYGPVPPTNLILFDSLTQPGKMCLVKGTEAVCPTNNRGELIAIIITYMAIIQGRLPRAKKYVIVSDSQYCIRTIEEWLDKWVKYKALKDKKNPDLLQALITLRKKIEIKFQFQRSHLKDASARNKFEELNYQADALAKLGVNSTRSEYKF